jgi:hypothetical protein
LSFLCVSCVCVVCLTIEPNETKADDNLTVGRGDCPPERCKGEHTAYCNLCD